MGAWTKNSFCFPIGAAWQAPRADSSPPEERRTEHASKQGTGIGNTAFRGTVGRHPCFYCFFTSRDELRLSVFRPSHEPPCARRRTLWGHTRQPRGSHPPDRLGCGSLCPSRVPWPRAFRPRKRSSPFVSRRGICEQQRPRHFASRSARRWRTTGDTCFGNVALEVSTALAALRRSDARTAETRQPSA